MTPKELADIKKAIAEIRTAVGQVPDKAEITKAIALAARQVRSKMEYAVGGDDEEDVTKNRLLTKSSTNPRVKEFQSLSDDIYLLSKILRVHPTQLKLWKDMAGSDFKKAMDSATSAEGSEWIPTQFSAELIDLVRLELKVAALHTHITMPSNPFTLPVVASDSTGYLIPEQTAEPESATKITASTPGTGNITLTAKKLGARVTFSEELREDSIIPVLPFIKGNIARALGDALEKATIDGDTSGTHQDSDVTATTEFRKAWNGYRKLAVAGAKLDLSNANPTAANFSTVRGSMGKYGLNPQDLAVIVSPIIYAVMTTFSEVITLDKYGPSATILTGELAKLWGIPVIVSPHIRDNLNASGVYDGATTDRSVALIVHKRAEIFGDKRQVTVKSFEYIETDQTVLVATQRLAFSRLYPAADKFVGVLFNVNT